MNYVTSIFDLSSHACRIGLNCSLYMQSESLITRARNKMVARFLDDESLTHLFWIDSDITFNPQSAIRLLLADRDVVAGVYPSKSLNWPSEGLPANTTRADFERRYAEYPFNPLGYGKTPVGANVDDNGFVEVAEAPTGFMVIKRDVFYRMMKRYPNLNYRPDGPPNHPKAHLHWLFFDCMVDPDYNRYLSEDFAFCRRWRDMGGRIFVDTECRLQHLGQHMYSGNIAENLKERGLW